MNKHLFIALSLLAACTAKEQTPAPATQPAPLAQPATPAPAVTGEAPSALTKIADRSTVCMVNDRDMGSPQIPVLVDGKTYYGCCKMCEKRLREEESVRTATDPESQQKVDKAVAVLARDPSGNVYYFADQATLDRKLGRP